MMGLRAVFNKLSFAMLLQVLVAATFGLQSVASSLHEPQHVLARAQQAHEVSLMAADTACPICIVHGMGWTPPAPSHGLLRQSDPAFFQFFPLAAELAQSTYLSYPARAPPYAIS